MNAETLAYHEENFKTKAELYPAHGPQEHRDDRHHQPERGRLYQRPLGDGEAPPYHRRRLHRLRSRRDGHAEDRTACIGRHDQEKHPERRGPAAARYRRGRRRGCRRQRRRRLNLQHQRLRYLRDSLPLDSLRLHPGRSARRPDDLRPALHRVQDLRPCGRLPKGDKMASDEASHQARYPVHPPLISHL